MVSTYQRQALMGATGIELIIALYDGTIRFLYRAIQCIEENDTRGRRIAVGRALDILMYLQARLRPDLAQSTSESLSDFYAAMFTMSLEASHATSIEQFHEVIACIRSVRDAWTVAARNPDAGRVLPRELRTKEELFSAPPPSSITEQPASARWSA
ncbi:flagellar export chaperone FliS [Edaphobacter albus]|uniref:flagellar export chaperone FliS n=1 Tax=Edaphobacter sp. 4G125 TaxID=2763071 RepID=UPI0016443DD1|nr:flagellar export chaperone FliS [Edaphobacter sp. 4G125]QNI38277.1 flagellar export chaperone FliS [Edaphobacter sp. 4G125]